MEKITLYRGTALVNERETRTVGYWVDKLVAKQDLQTIGWYGVPGRISETIEGLYDPTTNKYYTLVKNVSDTRLSDKDIEEKLKSSIKQKLTDEELKYLNLK